MITKLFITMKNILTLLLIVVCVSSPAQQKYTPIIFVHGMLGSGDSWAKPVQLFRGQEYPSEYLNVMDWNSLMFGQINTSKLLDSVVDHVIAKTGAEKVNLVGHSAGGGVCNAYLKDSVYAKKVENYIHLASGKLTNTPLVKTLNLYSPDDLITGGEDITGIENIAIPNKDHYEIATSIESFQAIFRFFNPNIELKSPSSLLPKNVSGRVLSLGENKPEINTTILIFAIHPETGDRTSKNPLATFITDVNGNWGPFLAEEKTVYEFVVKPTNSNKITVHYYREPFQSENSLVYLRTIPQEGMAAMLLSGIPKDKKQAALAIFSANKAVIYGRDSLIVNEIELSTEQLSPAKKTAIAHFLYDDNKDGKTNGNPLAAFQMFPFLNGVDVFLNSKSKELIRIKFNQNTLTLKPIPSDEGVMVVVFD